MRRFRWGAAVFVAFALIVVGVGGYIVYDNVINDSPDDAPVATVETPAEWFGDRKEDACPALRRVRNNAVFAYTVVHTSRLTGSPWPPAQSTAIRQLAAMATAYEALLSDATPQGKAALGSMLEYQTQLRSALEAAPSAAVYFQLSSSFATPEQREVQTQILELADTCSD